MMFLRALNLQSYLVLDRLLQFCSRGASGSEDASFADG